MMQKKTRAYLDLVESELSNRGITVKKWTTTASGRAYLKEKSVAIPKPTNEERLGVCFHEIGHIIYHRWGRKKRFIEEYEAEQYALKMLRAHGIPSETYETRAKAYVLRKIAEGWNRGLKPSTIPEEISEWLGMDFQTWVGFRAFVTQTTSGAHVSLYTLSGDAPGFLPE